MKPVALGIIGCGVIGPMHMQAAAKSPLIEMVAVADLIEERARKVAEQYGVKTVYTSGSALLDDPRIEGVVLALPVRERTPLVFEAMAKGKHVLIEKPIAASAADVRRFIAARGDLIAGCCSSRYRFPEGAEVATRFLASGALGPLRLIRARNTHPAAQPPKTPPPTWRLRIAENGGGILLNWGCYDLDYLLGINGWSIVPQTVLAQTWRVPPQFESWIAPQSDAETHLTALIRCANGTVINYERGEYTTGQPEAAWQIVGTRGTLQLKMVVGGVKTLVHDDTTGERGVFSQTLWEGEEDNAIVHGGPVTDFAAAIREHRQPRTSLEQALVVAQISDAIYASARSSAAVAIE